MTTFHAPPPTCGACGSSHTICVRRMGDKWCYYCEHCERPLPFEEIREGNP